MDLQFKIVHKQGSSNLAANALSRCHEGSPLCDVSSMYNDWLDRIKWGYHDDPLAMKLLAEYPTDEPKFIGFAIEDGLIRQHGRLWLGVNRLA
jgi:hypothetical protein